MIASYCPFHPQPSLSHRHFSEDVRTGALTSPNWKLRVILLVAAPVVKLKVRSCNPNDETLSRLSNVVVEPSKATEVLQKLGEMLQLVSLR